MKSEYITIKKAEFLETVRYFGEASHLKELVSCIQVLDSFLDGNAKWCRINRQKEREIKRKELLELQVAIHKHMEEDCGN